MRLVLSFYKLVALGSIWGDSSSIKVDYPSIIFVPCSIIMTINAKTKPPSKRTNAEIAFAQFTGLPARLGHTWGLGSHLDLKAFNAPASFNWKIK